MSWIPALNLGNSIKTGKSNSTDGTITFNIPFVDSNYVVILTPYVTIAEGKSGAPQAWVSGSLSSSSFAFITSQADGVYWMATYSNS
jgi:hypothetical protein